MPVLMFLIPGWILKASVSTPKCQPTPWKKSGMLVELISVGESLLPFTCLGASMGLKWRRRMCLDTGDGLMGRHIQIHVQMTDSPPQPHASLGRGQSVLLLCKRHLCPWLCQYRVNISYAEYEGAYITPSVSSHGYFSVNSARTNFTVLKQLMVPKECVMSCQEI